MPEGLSSSWIIAGKRLTKPRQYKQSSAQRVAVVASRYHLPKGVPADTLREQGKNLMLPAPIQTSGRQQDEISG